MRDARPPRGRVLILALGAVLALMGLALWRATAGSRTPDAPTAGEAETGASLAGAPATPAPAAAATPTSSGFGGARPQAAAGPSGARPSHPAAHDGAPALAGGLMDERHLMARLRALRDSDPPGAVALAREGNQRFPDSGDAPERTSILIHALVATDKGSEARGEAERMVNHYPDSDWVREVERFTGAHRHRNVGVNDAGQLIFR